MMGITSDMVRRAGVPNAMSAVSVVNIDTSISGNAMINA